MRRQSATVILFGLALLATPLLARADDVASAAGSAEALFENDVRPLLAERCFKCHGANKQENGLRLDHRDGLLTGGDAGPAIVPGKPTESLLVSVVRRQGELAMPPDEELTRHEVAALVRWIEFGAPWPDDEKPVDAPQIRSGPITAAERGHWAYQPVVRPDLPAVRDDEWCQNAIDQFILARLDEKGCTPVADSTKRTRIRRAKFDLNGLPPTLGEFANYLADQSPQAWPRLIDRLLDSRQYGERWGRHWLDIVRYADTAGETADYPVTQAWRYRNWILDAFNDDKPYDEFIREQIAGDIIAQTATAERCADLVTATGYLAVSRRFGFGIQQFQYLTIQDTIDTTGQAVLGLTLGCARCHDHKYDPVTVDDYYGWYGIFDSTRYALSADEKTKKERDFVPLIPTAEAELIDSERSRKIEEHQGAVAALEKERAELDEKLKAEGVTVMRSRQTKIDGELKDRKQRIDELSKIPYPVAYAVREGEPHDAKIHRRGNPLELGDAVLRRQLEILGGTPLSNPDTSSGRLDMAHWLTSAENPLTARVMVNRLWQYHFGQPLVETPNDFGVRGRAPSHPALLDWLAAEFISNGWSVKHMHRLIMTSRTYQLASSPVTDAEAALTSTLSPARELERTRLFGRFPRRRLEAEAIRDAMLVVSGRLDPSPAAEHPFPSSDSWDFSQHGPFYAVYPTTRRSVYLMTQRIKHHPFLTLFDGADTSASTAVRTETTTPTQALYLMNSPFVHEQAGDFASRVLDSSSADVERLHQMFEIALGRPPSATEIAFNMSFLGQYREGLSESGTALAEQDKAAWSALARTILVRNEFLFVE